MELKSKAPPSIGYAMFRIEIVTNGILGHAAPPSIGYAMFRIEIVTDGISRHVAYILSFVIM